MFVNMFWGMDGKAVPGCLWRKQKDYKISDCTVGSSAAGMTGVGILTRPSFLSFLIFLNKVISASPVVERRYSVGGHHLPNDVPDGRMFSRQSS